MNDRAASDSRPADPRSRFLRLLPVALLLAAVAAGTWFAWLGWDHQYYEVNGVPQGPYRPWQVVGCGITVVVAALVARRLASHWAGLLILPAAGVVGFAVPWSFDAASTDETGLWVVGLVILLVGGGLGLLVVVAAFDIACALLPGRRTTPPAAA